MLNVYVIDMFLSCTMVDNLSITRKYQWSIVWTKLIDLTTVTLNNGTYRNGGMKAKPESWENFLMLIK